MSEQSAGTTAIVHEPSSEFVESTNVFAFMQQYDIDDYDELIERTTTEVPGADESGIEWFWDELIEYLDIEFYEPYDTIRANSDGPQFSEWYAGGELNIAHNVVDRHATLEEPTRNAVACIWEGEDGAVRELTYHELHRQSNKVANALAERGIETGDTVGLYMPMVPEVVSILYGCFKAGAIAVPIFSGFGVEATATRIANAECRVLFTGDGFLRRGNPIFLKGAADEAIKQAGHVEHTIVFDRLGSSTQDRDENVPWIDDRDEWWHEAIDSQDDEYETKSLDSNQESMLLYSSGTTGEPKGIVHTHAGALTQAAKELHFGFDLKPADRFFWVSDIGWMMGPWTMIGVHTFGGTMFMYEGAPDYPQPDRFWEMIDRHSLTQFGISPTAIRALRKHSTNPESDDPSVSPGDGSDDWLSGHDLSSLRILGSTGEPWDAESWHWFYDNIGGGETPIINISGGTEIMGCFLMPMPNQPLKPCTLGGPGLGMNIDIIDEYGKSIADSHERGYLVARDSCPSMTKSLWSGDERYLEEYWSNFEDLWDHGDWAQQDEDGYWYLHGRADDTLNIAGRKVGPAEIEDALIGHQAVNQAAAVGVPDDTTGTAVVSYLVLESGETPSDELRGTLRELVGVEHGKPFRPREILFVDDLPKTQSGKIIRRVISSIYQGDEPGDLSSLENPTALESIKTAQ